VANLSNKQFVISLLLLIERRGARGELRDRQRERRERQADSERDEPLRLASESKGKKVVSSLMK
jgi:hypothetical protein